MCPCMPTVMTRHARINKKMELQRMQGLLIPWECQVSYSLIIDCSNECEKIEPSANGADANGTSHVPYSAYQRLQVENAELRDNERIIHHIINRPHLRHFEDINTIKQLLAISTNKHTESIRVEEVVENDVRSLETRYSMAKQT